MQDLKALEGKSLAELHEIAKALGIEDVMVKKRELIEKDHRCPHRRQGDEFTCVDHFPAVSDVMMAAIFISNAYDSLRTRKC